MCEKKKHVQNSKLVNSIVNAMVDEEMLKTDPQGSYTGKPRDPMETPQQDQDDL